MVPSSRVGAGADVDEIHRHSKLPHENRSVTGRRVHKDTRDNAIIPQNLSGDNLDN